MPRVQCQFYTAKFARCTHRSADETGYCLVHRAKAEALGPRPAEGHCLCVRRIQGTDQWCGQPNRAGETLCEWHWNQSTWHQQEQERRRQQELFEETTVQAYLNENPRQHWGAVARRIWMRTRIERTDPLFLEIRTANAIARRYFLRTTPEEIPFATFTAFWLGLWDQEFGAWFAEADPVVAPAAPPAPPMGQMGRLAADGQNVHTAAVAEQTNSNVDLLLEQPLIEGMDTLTTLTRWWMEMSPRPAFNDYWRVMEDVRHWFGKRTCKSTSDYLYQRVLNGLVSKLAMTEREMFTELVKRSWEECEEAVGMCCEGHIGRLANVLVGFDETFRPPVPVGEILQAKMAAIAEMKLSHKLKLQKAIAVMDELKIPLADREPWLEALEE